MIDLHGRHYLVTGGTGFIGSALVRMLVKAGAKLRVLDNNSRGSVERLSDMADRFEFIEGDIRDAARVKQAIAGVDGVLHLAYVNGTEYFYSKPDLVLDVGIRGMLNVIDGCMAQGVKELVLASSSEVYQKAEIIPTDESVPLIVPDVTNPRFSYGGGKIISELMALNYGREFFERVMIFRPHNVYGPQMGYEHVIPQFAMRMNELVKVSDHKELVFPIQGDGSETRAFIYIDDFAAGIQTLLEQGEHREIYHIGVMEEVSIRHIAEQVAKCYDRDIRIQPGELLEGGTPRRCPDSRKLMAKGFSPKVSLKDGIAQTVAWYRQKG